MAIAFSGIFYRWSQTTPETAALFRCAYALPVLVVLAYLERRSAGIPFRSRLLGYAAGALFGVDLILWHRAIEEVGVGLGTVLANLQVVLVVLLTWWLANERVAFRTLAAIPLALIGLVLVSGVLERDAYGRDPELGVVYGLMAAASYAGFLLLLRRRGQVGIRPGSALFDATLSATAVLVAVGTLTETVDFTPSWPAHGWLVAIALESQVLGWLFITVALPVLPAAKTSVTLLLQPVAALVLALLLLNEAPSALQISGASLLILGILIAHSRRQSQREPLFDTDSPQT